METAQPVNPHVVPGASTSDGRPLNRRGARAITNDPPSRSCRHSGGHRLWWPSPVDRREAEQQAHARAAEPLAPELARWTGLGVRPTSELAVVQLGVCPANRHEAVVGAALDNPPLLEHEHLIGVPDRA